MPPCCSSPLGRQECAPQPRHPGMPFTPWLCLLLLHRCRQVTPNGWEQMVPCHKCHPGSTAWAAPARQPDLMVGKSVLPGFSCLASSFPSLSVQRSAPHSSLGLPRTRWSPAPFMVQTTGWVTARPARPSSGSCSARGGSGWAELSPCCPAHGGAQAGQAARSYLGEAGQGELAQAGRCGRAGWHISPLPTPKPGGALLESRTSTHLGGCCSPPAELAPSRATGSPQPPWHWERCHAATEQFSLAHTWLGSHLGLRWAISG